MTPGSFATSRSRPRARAWRPAALGAACLAPIAGLAVMDPVVRGPEFHRYADARPLFGLPHAGDVLSNLPFVLVGIAGLVVARRLPAALGVPRALVGLFFAAVLGIGLGSGAYHAYPADVTLALDWLPIVLALAWLAALVIADRVDPRAGAIAAVALPAAAAAAVGWWWLGGGTAGGDMRAYALLQLTLVALVPVVLLLYPRGRLPAGDLLAGVGCFLLARAVNTADASLLDAIGVSGHTLKHLVAGAAAWCVLRAVRRARPAPIPAGTR